MDAPDGPMGLKRQVGERKSREAGRLDEKNYTNYPVRVVKKWVSQNVIFILLPSIVSNNLPLYIFERSVYLF
jgi:hypothetical protein